jgi:hypothetical protein
MTQKSYKKIEGEYMGYRLDTLFFSCSEYNNSHRERSGQLEGGRGEFAGTKAAVLRVHELL